LPQKSTKRREKDTNTNRQVAKDAKTIQACTFVGRFALPSLAFSAPWRFIFAPVRDLCGKFIFYARFKDFDG
jgi:hypothetical protein